MAEARSDSSYDDDLPDYLPEELSRISFQPRESRHVSFQLQSESDTYSRYSRTPDRYRGQNERVEYVPETPEYRIHRGSSTSNYTPGSSDDYREGSANGLSERHRPEYIRNSTEVPHISDSRRYYDSNRSRYMYDVNENNSANRDREHTNRFRSNQIRNTV